MTLQEALRWAGGRNIDLAAQLGVSGQVVANWVARGEIPPLPQWELEYVSCGKLRAAKRPNIVAQRAANVRKAAA